MRFLCAAIGAALLPVAAYAVTLQEIGAWRACTSDAQCILVDGACSKVAVNKRFKNSAEAYYAELAAQAECVDRFWVPKEVIAQCKPLAASKAREGDDLVKNSECAAVAKPKE